MRPRGCGQRRGGRLPASIAALLLTCSTTSAQSRSLTYSKSVPGPGGSSRQISFDGALESSRVSGILEVDGVRVSVAGAVTRSGISGRFDWPTGGKAGEFSGYVDSENLRGSYVLDGMVGRWRVPLSEVPAEVKGLVEPTRRVR